MDCREFEGSVGFESGLKVRELIAFYATRSIVRNAMVTLERYQIVIGLLQSAVLLKESEGRLAHTRLALAKHTQSLLAMAKHTQP